MPFPVKGRRVNNMNDVKASFILFLIFLFLCALDIFCGVINLKEDNKPLAGATFFAAGAAFVIMTVHASKLLG